MVEQSFKDILFALNRFAVWPNTLVKRWHYAHPPQQGYFVNLGSGGHPVAGMINCDGNLFRRPDCWLDLRNRLPFPDGSCALVTCSHTLEHLYPDECIEVLREIRRILRPGGLARIATPSMSHALEMAQGKAHLDWPRNFTDPVAASVNYLFCDGQHKYAYCFHIMDLFARQAGFAGVADVSHANEACERVGVKLPQEPPGSLIVELTT
ncbi:MAG: methyltransferase domain-containing protein [Phycisphaerales bacterium]|nr:methyltransferase domain-containing protein [Phycisphaerales bacterium]